MKKFILALCLCTFLLSCNNSFYQRHYRGGLYLLEHKESKTVKREAEKRVQESQEVREEVFASIENKDLSFLNTSAEDTNVNKKRVEYPSKSEPDYYQDRNDRRGNNAPNVQSNYEQRSNTDFYRNREDSRMALLMACGGCMFFPASIFGFYMARRVMREINADPNLEGNRGTAQAALIISSVTMGIAALVVLLYVVIIFMALFLI